MIKKVANKFGLDKAIIFTTSANIIGTLGNILSVILVVKYLTDVEQGFYYTFGSIVAIQIFFELGLNSIITQYVAHEVSNLKWQGNDILLGESKYKSRLSSLLHFSVNWYLSFASILLIVLIVVGFIFFKKYDTTIGSVIWLPPWILLAVGTCISLIFSPMMAFLQGLGKVKEIARIQLILSIFKLSIIWAGLILGFKLYILGMSSIFGVLLLVILIVSKFKKTFTNIWRTQIVERVNYRKEIFPYQWKIALSWISGYFMFQLFNPVLFATEGPVVAGQMGITLAALNGVLSLSGAWITTKVPLFSGLIAQNQYTELDSFFNLALKQSALINLGALVFVAVGIYLINFFNIQLSGKLLSDRFLNYIPLFFMLVPIFLNHFVYAWATYLRCHKKEPFLIISIVGGILCSLSTILLGKYFGVIGVTGGYCLITILMFLWAYIIFKTKKLEWHPFKIN